MSGPSLLIISSRAHLDRRDPHNLTPPKPCARSKVIKICSLNPSSFPCYYDPSVMMGMETEYDCGVYTRRYYPAQKQPM